MPMKMLVPSPLLSTWLLILTIFSTYVVEMSHLIHGCTPLQTVIRDRENIFEHFTKKVQSWAILSLKTVVSHL